MNYSRFVFTCRLPILSMAFFFLEILCPQNAQADTDHNIMTVNIGASSSPTEETLEVTFDGTNYVASDFIFAIDPETQEASLNSYIPTGTVEELVIPAAITYQGKHYPVSDIGRQAFYNNVNGELTHVIIPNSVKRIGSYAFAYCSISSITIGNNVTHIEEGAFNRCSRLSNVTIPNSVISIGEYAFQGCRISSISIPKSVNSIGHNAFYICYLLDNITVEEGNLYYDSRNNCNAIIETGTNTLVVGGNKSVIPNSVTRIGNGAYYGRSSITNIDIPDNVISIGDEAFMFCSGLTDIMIPNSVTSIGNYAFSGCSSLTNISIPNSVVSIGYLVFKDCSSLTDMMIPNSVTSIGYGVLAFCKALKKITVEEGNLKFDSRENCNAIIETETHTLIAGCKETIIPTSVTGIGNCAFEGCYDLTCLEIPNSVTSIGNIAFGYCSSLTDMMIPNSVTSIGNYAFEYCESLTSATIPNSVTSIGQSVFSGCSALNSIINLAEQPQPVSSWSTKPVQCILRVKKGCKESYANANFWNSFQIEELPIILDPNYELKTMAEIQAFAEKLFETDAEKVEKNVRVADLNGDGVFSIMDLVKLIRLSTLEAYQEECLGTIIWEGNAVIDNWSEYGFFADGAIDLLEAGMKVGSILRFYIKPMEEEWGLQVIEGHWGKTWIYVPNDYNLLKHNFAIELEITQAIFDQMITAKKWGNACLLYGDNVVCTKITIE